MNERQVVTGSTFFLCLLMLAMAYAQPDLWEIELFKLIMQAVIISGFLNMILAFHFTANKSDELKSDNTGKAFDAIKATAQANNDKDADLSLEPGQSATIEAKGNDNL